MTDDSSNPTPPDAAPTRRRALMLGAVGASAVLSIRPALAQTQASVINCEIPVPDAGRAGSYIAADGSVVPAGTEGAFPPASLAFKGVNPADFDLRHAFEGVQMNLAKGPAAYNGHFQTVDLFLAHI